MSKSFEAVKSADWRKQLRINNSRTRIVIAIFLLLYIGLGVLIDIALALNTYPNAPISSLIAATFQGKIFPIATVVMTGIAIISIWVSFSMHDKIMLLGTESHEITPETAKGVEESQLYNIIEELKIAAGLKYMPRVFIIEAGYMNAFASGYSEKSAMVAITRGLLQKLTRAEVQAVMAHEVSHIRHMDIKLTLVASILSNIMIIVIDILFRGVLYGGMSSRRSSSDGERGGGGAAIIILVIVVLRFLLPLITMVLLMYLSRTREYMADAGAVELTRENKPMATALMKISGDYETNQETYRETLAKTQHEQVRHEAYIFDPHVKCGFSSSSLTGLFSTHPSLKKRLAALGFVEKT
jgi:heat shock protein HtpX